MPMQEHYNPSEISVSYACDDNYSSLALTSITSLLKNLKQGVHCRLYISTFGLSNEAQSRFKKLEENFEATVRFLISDEKRYKNLPSGRYTSSMYLRYELADALPHVDSIIYLDCDTIVRKDLSCLCTILSDTTPIYAARDYADLCGGPFAAHKEELGLPAEQLYFNSGVLLLNLAEWRKHSFTSQVLECLRKNAEKIVFPDQDVLNLIFGEKVRFLDQSWNMQIPMITTHRLHPKWCPELRKVIYNPSIVHFTGPIKPWDETRYVPFQREFLYYQSLSPANTATNATPSAATKRALDYASFEAIVLFAKFKRLIKTMIPSKRVAK